MSIFLSHTRRSVLLLQAIQAHRSLREYWLGILLSSPSWLSRPFTAFPRLSSILFDKLSSKSLNKWRDACSTQRKSFDKDDWLQSGSLFWSQECDGFWVTILA